MQQRAVRYSVLISFLAGLVAGMLLHRGLLWPNGLVVMDEQRLEQQLNLIFALQEENRQLNEELFSPRFREYPLVNDGELPSRACPALFLAANPQVHKRYRRAITHPGA